MSDMVERVAFAIANSSIGIHLSREQLDIAARAAIEAMRPAKNHSFCPDVSNEIVHKWIDAALGN